MHASKKDTVEESSGILQLSPAPNSGSPTLARSPTPTLCEPPKPRLTAKVGSAAALSSSGELSGHKPGPGYTGKAQVLEGELLTLLISALYDISFEE